MTGTTSLRDLTTLEVGGEAARLAEAQDCEQVMQLLQAARERDWPVLILGGGSNMLVSDQGFSGLVLRWTDRSLELLQEAADQVRVRVGGGWVWDEWVAYSLSRNWAGLECLSGIPGTVGAAPIQNIGAYGQEVCHHIEACWVLDLGTGQQHRFTSSDCCFGYRDSRFKRDWKGRFLITSVEFRLVPAGRPVLRYRELQERLGQQSPSLEEVRQTVLCIRRSKSMVWDRSDPNHRSAGSFFVNPVVSQSFLEALRQEFPDLPSWPVAPDKAKLSAAWLIERSGFARGYARGRAGLSSNHVLALINRGGAQAHELVELAREIRLGVWARFGLKLHPEPEFIGFSESPDELLEPQAGGT